MPIAMTKKKPDSAPPAGHNSKAKTTTVGGIAGDALRQYVERIERLEEEKRTLAEDIKEVFAEAKGNGFDVKIMRKIITIRKREASEVEKEETLLDLYKAALGMQPSLFDGEEE
jgi:uncharacterized protein (UPF0335 family)